MSFGVPETIAVAWMTGGIAKGVFDLAAAIRHRDIYTDPPSSKGQAIAQITGPVVWAVILFTGGFFA